jgi:hypothetical protein
MSTLDPVRDVVLKKDGGYTCQMVIRWKNPGSSDWKEAYVGDPIDLGLKFLPAGGDSTDCDPAGLTSFSGGRTAHFTCAGTTLDPSLGFNGELPRAPPRRRPRRLCRVGSGIATHGRSRHAPASALSSVEWTWPGQRRHKPIGHRHGRRLDPGPRPHPRLGHARSRGGPLTRPGVSRRQSSEAPGPSRLRPGTAASGLRGGQSRAGPFEPRRCVSQGVASVERRGDARTRGQPGAARPARRAHDANADGGSGLSWGSGQGAAATPAQAAGRSGRRGDARGV